MKLLQKRIENRIRMTKMKFKSDRQFSMIYAIMRIVEEYSCRLKISCVSKFVKIKRENWIQRYLILKLQSKIAEYKTNKEKGIYEKNANIWVCWWDGFNNAPPLVKKCISSIRKNAGSHKVIFIDKSTISNYIDIPEYMIKKVKSGNMGLAHLSDYIRISLLEKYGGLWLDATIFCAKEIPENYYEIPFFTCKSNIDTECGYISKMRWTTFVLGGWKGNIFFKFLKEAFEVYWVDAPGAVDYLFFDHLIDIAYKEILEIKEEIEAVPINNLHRDDLQAAMNLAISGDKIDKVIHPDTVLYKLSWREKYEMKTSDGQDSIYKKYLEI